MCVQTRQNTNASSYTMWVHKGRAYAALDRPRLFVCITSEYNGFIWVNLSILDHQLTKNSLRSFCLYLSNELHDEVHHKLGVLVEHALPQLVHHPLREVEDVVDQNLITAPAAEGQRGIFTWRESSSQRVSHTSVRGFRLYCSYDFCILHII